MHHINRIHEIDSSEAILDSSTAIEVQGAIPAADWDTSLSVYVDCSAGNTRLAL